MTVTAAALLLARPASAAEPTVEAPDGPPLTPWIQGGSPASSCQWPTLVGLFNGSSICSGTLVHPRLVTTAAHCIDGNAGGPPARVRFGEDLFDPVFQVDIDYCQINPGWIGSVGGEDFAFCVLDNPVDLPPTPPAMGCELDALEMGADVMLAGFGLTDEGANDAGTKRWGPAQIESVVVTDTIAAGDSDLTTCGGDSGGTGFVQLDDGGWRSWGILSGGPQGCDNQGIYVSMAYAAAWIEEQSGFDITPCHDADGTWNPTAACSGFASEPMAGGSWASDCSGPVGDEPSTCGPAFSEPEDLLAPTVTIVAPTDGTNFPGSLANFDITIEADDGDGYAVVQVELYLEGEFLTDRERDPWDEPAPWVFGNAEFTTGTYTLTARAYDYFGNVGESEAVTFTVGDVPGEEDTGTESETDTDTDTTEEETESDSDSETESGTDDLPVVDDGGESGCACSTGDRGAPSPALLLPVLLLGVARPRRRSA